MNLELFFNKIPLFVKLIAVYLTSIVSFFMTDLMVWFGIVAGGINPIAFILYIVMRAVFGYLVSRFVLGSKESDDLRRELVLATLIFGAPLMSFIEVLRILSGVSIKIPLPPHISTLPPYVSIMRLTLIMALLYEFPRLILLIVIKRFLNGKIPVEGVR